jgi:hypothetical protein
MTVSVDQAALAGVGVAGVISISSADGPYTPFDGIMGVVLLIVLLYFYDGTGPNYSQSIRFFSAPAAVLALVLCLIVSPIVQACWYYASETWREFAVDSTLTVLWIILFGLAFLRWTQRMATHAMRSYGTWQRRTPESSVDD